MIHSELCLRYAHQRYYSITTNHTLLVLYSSTETPAILHDSLAVDFSSCDCSALHFLVHASACYTLSMLQNMVWDSVSQLTMGLSGATVHHTGDIY